MPFDVYEVIGLAENPLQTFIMIMRYGGLIIFYPILLWMCLSGWLNWIQNKYTGKKKYVLLAIDIPKLNEQSMKAVEQILAALHGVHFGPNRKEKYWLGVCQDKFSLEIVSIDGYIQYFIHCDDYNADLVKGAVFAQYPDAEIIEVEDYTQNVPQKYPNDTHDIWSTEFTLAKPDVYPIKTYEHFEHSLTGIFADPMAAVLELLSRLRPGEQVWLQIVITPEGYEWREKGLQEVNKLIERKAAVKRGVADFIGDAALRTLEATHDAVFTTDADSNGPTMSQDGSPGIFMNMTTGEKIVIEEIQKKIARLAFQTKFRFVYIAPKEVMHSYRVVGSVFGAVKQFNTLDLNAFKAGRLTVSSGPDYVFIQRRRNARKNRMMLGAKHRSNWSGEAPSVLSNVELATIFHFPAEQVRAPLVSKAEAKKAEPPARLPVEQTPFEAMRQGHQRVSIESTPEAPDVVSAEQEMLDPEPIAQQTVPPLPPQTTNQTVPLPPVDHSRYPMHSMPGLPPGVRPVDGVSAPVQNQAAVPTLPSVYNPAAQVPQLPVQPYQPSASEGPAVTGSVPTNLPM